jgi:hypothetical protein
MNANRTLYGSWNAKEIEADGLGALDLPTALRVALNEAPSVVFGIDCGGLVKSYVKEYFENPEILSAVAEEAFRQFASDPPTTQAGVTAEFVLGHAVARTAGCHVYGDLEAANVDFMDNAKTTLGLLDDLARIRGLVTADRLDGGRMSTKCQSAQHCTPQQVFDIVEERFGCDAAERVSTDDYVREAQRLMDQLFGKGLDFDDVDQIVSDFTERYGDLEELGQFGPDQKREPEAERAAAGGEER